MNAINIAQKITGFATAVALKILKWRWKANLKHAEVSYKTASKLRSLAAKAEMDGDDQVADATDIRETIASLEGK